MIFTINFSQKYNLLVLMNTSNICYRISLVKAFDLSKFMHLQNIYRDEYSI